MCVCIHVFVHGQRPRDLYSLLEIRNIPALAVWVLSGERNCIVLGAFSCSLWLSWVPLGQGDAENRALFLICWDISPAPLLLLLGSIDYIQWVSLWHFQESSVTGLWILVGKVLKHNKKPNLSQPTNQPSQNHVPSGKFYFSVRFPSRKKLGQVVGRKLEKLNFELFCWLFVGLFFLTDIVNIIKENLIFMVIKSYS